MPSTCDLVSGSTLFVLLRIMFSGVIPASCASFYTPSYSVSKLERKGRVLLEILREGRL